MRSGLPIARLHARSRCGTRSTFICAADSRPSGVATSSMRRVIRVERRVELLDAGHLVALGVLLEEQLAADARRRAHQRHRPALQVLHHQRRDQRVVAHQVDLGGAAGGVDHPLGIGDAQRRRQATPAAVRRVASRAVGPPAVCAAGGLAPGGLGGLVDRRVVARLSRAIAAGGLSARRPWNTEWRMRPLRVHSPKATSQTSSGLTQCALRGMLGVGGERAGVGVQARRACRAARAGSAR